ncbi:MAG TPA: response regulator transcription factor [Alphaproteobacteria bacterium]|nr:response regulator transcription factor [Alphaproteobacteria bacterium]
MARHQRPPPAEGAGALGPCRLVIADDHPLYRDALRLAIAELLPEAEVAEADSFDSLRARLEAAPETDLVLLDLNMPGSSGFSGLLFLRAQYAAVPVAVISANEAPSVVRRALDLGALGYIPKSATAADIRAALTALLAGETWLPPALAPRGHAARADAELAARLASLTPQQIRVLMMLSEGLLNKQVAHALGVSEATVKAHVSAILQKLKVDNRTQAVILAKRLAENAAPSGAELLDLAASEGEAG